MPAAGFPVWGRALVRRRCQLRCCRYRFRRGFGRMREFGDFGEKRRITVLNLLEISFGDFGEIDERLRVRPSGHLRWSSSFHSVGEKRRVGLLNLLDCILANLTKVAKV